MPPMPEPEMIKPRLLFFGGSLVAVLGGLVTATGQIGRLYPSGP